MSTLSYHAARRPHPGKNHDATFISPDARTFAVFDGAGRDVASLLALSLFTHIYAAPEANDDTAPSRLGAAFEDTQRLLLTRLGGTCLTTATALDIRPDSQGWKASYAHAGDSRLYLYMGGVLEQLTSDESQRLPNGRIDASNFLGSPAHVLKQVASRVVPADARFLLVSDGVVDDYYTGNVTDEQIGHILGSAETPKSAVIDLLAAASVPDDASAIAVFGHPQ